MTRVDPEDDSIERWVAFHYLYDPERSDRRNVIVDAFNSDADFRDLLDRAGSELRAAIANGAAEKMEHLGGWRWPAGRIADQAETRLYPKRLR